MSPSRKTHKRTAMHARRWTANAALVGAVSLSCAGPAWAQDAAAPAKPAGLLPVPEYAGDLWSRSTLTGDWGGTRTDLANKGVQLDINLTQYVQGVASGGRDGSTRYGGGLDYLLNLDLMRMGVLPGALLTIRAETRYGEAANDISGALLPVNTEGYFPLTRELDDEIAFNLTTVRYAQFLCEQFGLVVGKFDTLESTNEFAGGRGVHQFMNGRFVFPEAGALSVPYSTLGAGVIVMPVKNLTITSLVMNTNDSSTTTGFADVGEGWTWLTSAQYQYKLGALPGGQGVTVAYAGDNDFKSLASGLVFNPGQGLAFAGEDHTWFVAWDVWQYVWVKDAGERATEVANGVQDHQGVGLFLRMGFADESTNPIELTIAGGVGAKGLIPTREGDTMGLAYSYDRIQESRIAGVADLKNNSQAFELFYNLEVTPATHLTFDLQHVEPLQGGLDPALVLGARLDLRF